jgi:hypothetical protein
VAEVVAADQPDGDSTPGNSAPEEDDYASVAITPLPTQSLSVSLEPVVSPRTGEPVMVGATATGGSGPVTTILFHRQGGAATFSETTMSEHVPGRFRASMPGAQVTDRGIQYYVQASAAGETVTAPGADYASIGVRLTEVPVMSLSPRTFRLAGIPMAADGDGDPLSVFDELGPYGSTSWRYGTWNGTEYVDGAAARPAVPGQGFWIISRDSATITASGVSTDLKRATYPCELHPGFNQISNPFSFAIEIASVVLTDSVVPVLYAYDGDLGYRIDETTLTPGEGYWIHNLSGTARVIRFPTGPSTAPTAPPPWELRDGESGWSIEATAIVGAWRDRFNRFGMRDRATDGLDATDLFEPPPVPSGGVRLSFVAEDAAELLVDYRAPHPEGAVWRLRLSSDVDESAFRVEFDDPEALPLGWQLVATDVTGTRRSDLVSHPVLASSSARLSPAREWHVIAGTPGFVEAASEKITRHYAAGVTTASLEVGPNPFRSSRGTEFLVSLPAEGDAALAIYDLAGRRVRMLVRDRLPHGIHRIAWDGRGDDGSTVAGGVYFARLRTADATTTRKVAVLR